MVPYPKYSWALPKYSWALPKYSWALAGELDIARLATTCAKRGATSGHLGWYRREFPWGQSGSVRSQHCEGDGS